ncbi:MAG TPA: Tn3 family transposase [Puia sp.]|nr:Tn3 family transposase [Puia sp.]
MFDQNKRLNILTNKEIQILYGIPQFIPEERDIYFTLDPLEEKQRKSIRYTNAAVYFILQLGYFKAKQQFLVFEPQDVSEDIRYILQRYYPGEIQNANLTISKPTRLSQQTQILKLFDYHICDREWKKKLQEKANQLVTIYTKPVYVFRELLNFLEYHRIMLPGYTFMQEEVIGKAITGERNRLCQAVIEGIPNEQRIKLDGLLTAEESLYQLTLLKHEPKDFSYREIHKEVEKQILLADLYQLAKRFLPSLHISNENIKYYASLITYHPIREIKRMKREVAYAYLLCFISYRYQKVSDNLVNTFIYHVNKLNEEAEENAKEQMASEKLAGNKNLKNAGKILSFFTDDTIPDDTLFGKIKERAFTILSKEQFTVVSRYILNVALDQKAYEWKQIVLLSTKFKRRLRHLFLSIPFESKTRNDPLLQAAAFLKTAFTENKSLKDYAPDDLPQTFIPPKYERYVFDTQPEWVNGKKTKIKVLNLDKYEFLVYLLLKEGLDAGDIFIKDSRDFRSLEDDLVDEELWRTQKEKLIKSLNLPYLDEPIETILARKEAELEALIKRVNDRIKNGENPDIKITGTGENLRWHLVYHNDEEPVDHPLYSRLPKIGIVDLLLFVHQKTNCLSAFTHLLDRYIKTDVDIRQIIACLVAFGENIGLLEMAESSDISYQSMLTTARNFLYLENLKKANDLVTNALAKLSIFKYFNIEEDTIHGSIDGQKIDTQINTINARHSPKYFGLRKGVASISLIANNIPVNARIIGTHEHESHFLYDLVFNNTSDVDPDIVSTDDHGINQVNHMILDIFGCQFSPRYVNLNSDTKDIYGFHDLSFYKDCIVKPYHKTNKQLIIQEWPDNILRIIVSLALKTTTQSTIIRKLSSHLRRNRTKKAMWEFDNIIKSIDMLRYIDSLEVRQNIQKALNRGEAYHKLKREVFHAHRGKFRVKTELEQNIWNECARLITNCIIFYQAYILSTLLEQKEKEGKREEADIIKRISPIAWQNVNLLGRFEFKGQQKTINIQEMINLYAGKIEWQQLKIVNETIT